jgi:hypothetical protein
MVASRNLPPHPLRICLPKVLIFCEGRTVLSPHVRILKSRCAQTQQSSPCAAAVVAAKGSSKLVAGLQLVRRCWNTQPFQVRRILPPAPHLAISHSIRDGKPLDAGAKKGACQAVDASRSAICCGFRLCYTLHHHDVAQDLRRLLRPGQKSISESMLIFR